MRYHCLVPNPPLSSQHRFLVILRLSFSTQSVWNQTEQWIGRALNQEKLSERMPDRHSTAKVTITSPFYNISVCSFFNGRHSIHHPHRLTTDQPTFSPTFSHYRPASMYTCTQIIINFIWFQIRTLAKWPSELCLHQYLLALAPR